MTILMKNHKKIFIYNAFTVVTVCIIAVIKYDTLDAFLEDKIIVGLFIAPILLVPPSYFLGIKLGKYVVRRRKKVS